MKLKIISVFLFLLLIPILSTPIIAETEQEPSVLPLEIVKVVQTPENPQPGETAQLQITIKNNDFSMFKDIVATLDLEGGNIPITSIGSNSNLIKTLDYNKLTTITYNFLINPDATPGPYNVPLKIKFTDPRQEIFEITHLVGFIIQTQPQYLLTIEEATQTNQGLKIGVSIYNTGTGTMKFIRTSIQETEYIELNSLNEQYLGNLDPDEFETATYYINPKKTDDGKFPLTMDLIYQDDFNDVQKFSKTIKIPKNYELLTAETEKTSSFGSYLLIYFGLGLFVIFLSFMVLMLLDVEKQSIPEHKKMMWRVIILTGTGAVIYYFIGRTKK